MLNSDEVKVKNSAIILRCLVLLIPCSGVSASGRLILCFVDYSHSDAIDLQLIMLCFIGWRNFVKSSAVGLKPSLWNSGVIVENPTHQKEKLSLLDEKYFLQTEALLKITAALLYGTTLQSQQ